MFGRRDKRSAATRLRQWLWPRGGIRRSVRYLLHRLGRSKASPYSIAAGFACGAAASFTPLVGVHFVAAALLALCLRASIVASAVGTAIGNPWTLPLIWFGTYETGRALGFGGSLDGERIDFVDRFGSAWDAVTSCDLEGAAEAAGPIVEPMFVGGGLLGGLAWAIFFLLLYPLLGAYKRSRETRMQIGRARRRASLTGAAGPEGRDAASAAGH